MTDKPPGITQAEIIEDLLTPFQTALKAGGIDKERLVRKLNEQLEAKRRVITKVKGRGTKKGIISSLGLGWVKAISTSEESVYERTTAELTIQQKATIEALKLIDAYPAEKHQIDTTATIVNVSKLTDEERGLLKAASRRKAEQEKAKLAKERGA